MRTDDLRVRVHSSWNDWRNVEVKLGDIHGAHWHQPLGAPHPVIHGFVACSRVIASQLPHDCNGQTPHYVCVCLLKRHVTSSAYAELVRRAGTCPEEAGAPPAASSN